MMNRRAPSIRTSKTESRSTLSRRTFLRGVLGGTVVALAMPTMESMLGTHGTAYADGTQFPQRFGVFFWGNGVVKDLWVPSSTGAGYTLSTQLSPFANVKDYVSVVTGMNSPAGYNHGNGPAMILTGDLPDTSDVYAFNAGPARAPSVDQIIANAIGGTTAHRSIQVGVVRYTHGGQNSVLMLDNISWSGANTPLRADMNPASVFDRLFGADFKLPPVSGSGQAAGGSGPSARDRIRSKMLDAVMADAGKLRERLGQRDRERLEQHLDAIRSIQKRLSLPAASVSASCNKPVVGGSVDPTDFNKLVETTDLTSDIVRMALACDLTRVFAYQWSTPASHAGYPQAGINDSFHETCHTDYAPHDRYNAGVKFIMQRFAGLLEKLKSTPEGTGNLLDNACVLGTSCIAMQTAESGHVTDDWPLLVAGRAGGKLKAGIHYRSPNAENAQKVPFTCMKAMGLPVTEWGVGPGYVNQPVGELLAS